jgi:segregation and condensation protein B
LEKELIEIRGKSDGVGRPVLYGTSDKFMEYFGINDLKDLPNPKDFAKEENTIGEENDMAFVASTMIEEETAKENTGEAPLSEEPTNTDTE